MFAILQKYDFSSKSQLLHLLLLLFLVVCDTAKVRFFKQITTCQCTATTDNPLFAILQKYDFSSKSQHCWPYSVMSTRCLRYCKSTIFQANHNWKSRSYVFTIVVCNTAKVRFFKQITTTRRHRAVAELLFAILQKYDFSSKSQLEVWPIDTILRCLRYCKSTIFQANHNSFLVFKFVYWVVCDTAKVRFFKQITTKTWTSVGNSLLFAILQKYDFSSKSQL